MFVVFHLLERLNKMNVSGIQNELYKYIRALNDKREQNWDFVSSVDIDFEKEKEKKKGKPKRKKKAPKLERKKNNIFT